MHEEKEERGGEGKGKRYRSFRYFSSLTFCYISTKTTITMKTSSTYQLSGCPVLIGHEEIKKKQGYNKEDNTK